MFKIPKWEEDVPKTNIDFGKAMKKKKNKDFVSQQTEKVTNAPPVNQNANKSSPKKNKNNTSNVFTVTNNEHQKNKKRNKRKAKLNKRNKLQNGNNDNSSSNSVITDDEPGKLLLNPNKRKHSETFTNEDSAQAHENKKRKKNKQDTAKHNNITNTMATKVVTKIKIPDKKNTQIFIKEDKVKVIETKKVKVNKNKGNDNIVNALNESSVNNSMANIENKKSKKRKKNKSESDSVTTNLKLNANSNNSKSVVNNNVPNGIKTNSKKEKLKKILEMNSNRNKIDVTDSGSKLRQRMLEKLKAAQFRYLNEKLYTSSGSEAKQLFQSDPEAFQTYHQGYQLQVKKWPVNPLDVIVTRILKMPKSHTVVDMGCGEAALSKRVPQTVRSFDLVAAAPGVEVCDIAHTPLLSCSTDVAVYCLALMGTDLTQYLLEANRILKMGGHLLIAEVESRFDKVDDFTAEIERLGFKLKKLDNSHQVFFFMEFVKMREPPVKKSKLPALSLKPCLYKRR